MLRLLVFSLFSVIAVVLTQEGPPPADDDLVTLAPYLLQVNLVPEEDDVMALANRTQDYADWKTTFEEKLKSAFIQANIATKPKNAEAPTITIVKTEVEELSSGSKSLKIQFYVNLPPLGLLSGSRAEKIYRVLGTSELWDVIERQVLQFPTALTATEEGRTGNRTLSIIAFIMGWVCLAALIVILAYLGIKYRDGIKSLARRIEHWSNPNRNGYSNLGGENQDWRTETDTRGPYEEIEREEKPKKKLRAPGGLLTEVEEVAGGPSYGTVTQDTKDSTQVRLSELASSGGDVTPPMTPTTMQKHLIKKYQEKQVGEKNDEPLTATSSEIFPDDFADCVEEEEILQVQP